MKPAENQAQRRTASSPDDGQAVRDAESRRRIVTLPNAICLGRLLGSFALFYLAFAGELDWFVYVFVGLNLSDWVDGRLARWLNQRSDFGARLDSLADSVLYGAMLFGMAWLKWDAMGALAPWWATALASYYVTSGAGLWKFGRIPSYHTYAAKITQCFVLMGVVFLMLDYNTWMFRLACVLVTLTNLETLVMTWILPEWRADVSSLWKVLRERSASSQSDSDS